MCGLPLAVFELPLLVLVSSIGTTAVTCTLYYCSFKKISGEANVPLYLCCTYHVLFHLLAQHHHFAELGKDLQDSLGRIPDEYLAYFTSRFPKLVLHVYDAMSWFTSEPSFQPFY